MATFTHKIDPSIKAKIQVWSDDHTITGFDALATGDLLNVVGSLGRYGNGCSIVIKGTADVTLLFNYELKGHVFSESSADTTITFPSDLSGIKAIRLLAGVYNFTFPITSIQIVALTASGTTANNISILVY